jgi:endonuclease/exonuclease/phosphatase family metal-dependent hydrolase
MKLSVRFGLAVLCAFLITATAAAESFTVLTYNLGLLKVLGSDYVPLVDARSKAAPAALAAYLAEAGPQIVLLEEAWDDATAAAIIRETAGLGYVPARPTVHGMLLGSGMLLLVKAPVRLVDWKLTRFARNTFMDGFTRKGVLEATLESADTGRRIALVGLHTVAIDTRNYEPVDRKQVDVFTAQTKQILETLHARSAGGTIPALLLGDFNVGPGYADALYRGIADSGSLCESGAVLFSGEPLITWDPGNPLVKYGNFPNEPPAKIDHVFLQDSPDARWKVEAARVAFSDPVEGLNLVPKKDALRKSAETSPAACPLSDHYGFLVELELQ